MELSALRDWLIARGVPAEELDNIQPPPVLDDYGNALALLLQFVNNLGEGSAALLQMFTDQQNQIAALTARVEALEHA